MRLLLALLTAVLLPAAAMGETVALGERSYDIQLPPDPSKAPILLALHGGGGDPAQFARSTGLGRAGVAAGYAVIFPAGSGRRAGRLLTWNGGYCCGYAARQRVDDMTFLRAVVQDAATRFGLDAGRVYIAGMSNGSIMAETFAATYPESVRAVAAVAGTMDTETVRVAGRVPALIIHGTADTMVPYGGGKGDTSLTRTPFASVNTVVEAFLAPWGAGIVQRSRRIDSQDDGTAVEIMDHQKGGKVVLRLITVEGGAHHWPGGRKLRQNGGQTAEIDANEEILQFFAMYR